MMDDRTLTALRGSIGKWQAIVDGTGINLGAADCPLCVIYASGVPRESQCSGCPVMVRTGEKYCFDTPYYTYVEADGPNSVRSRTEAARAELDFLISLLPEGVEP